MSVSFRGGPQDGVSTDIGPPGEHIAYWDAENARYVIRDEDGEAQGFVSFEIETHRKFDLKASLRYGRFWSLLLMGLSIVAQVPMAFVGDFRVRSLAYMISWCMVLFAWVLK